MNIKNFCDFLTKKYILQKLYQHVCSECNKPIVGRFHTKDGKYMCPEDYDVSIPYI